MIDLKLKKVGWYLGDYSVVKVESLQGRMVEAERQVEGLFESLLTEVLDEDRT
jgi:hypothetical protein